jgi:hypothetical protein
VSQENPTSIGEAIESFTEDDVASPTSEEETNTDVGEGEAEGVDEDGEGEGEADETDESDESKETDEDDETDETDESDESKETDEDDETKEDESEDEALVEAEDEDDFFDTLTPEALRRIKEDPDLNALRRGILRGYNRKMSGKSKLLKLGEAYEADPIGVTRAIAQANGLVVSLAQEAIPGATPAKETPAPGGEQTPAEAQAEKVKAAKAKIEGLFGDKVGTEVREAFDEYIEAMTGVAIAPIQQNLSGILDQNANAKLAAGEAEWRIDMKDVLTKEVEQKVVELGNSGRYLPGKTVSPAQFLKDLTTIAISEINAEAVPEARRESSKKLARKIEKNKRDREPTRRASSKSKVDTGSRLTKDPGSFNNLSEALAYADKELKAEE